MNKQSSTVESNNHPDPKQGVGRLSDDTAHQTHVVTKIKTGIHGFDLISKGGLPKGRTTLVAGTSGCGKTVMVLQYLVAGITRYNENGVLVTFEEHPDDISNNMISLNWPLKKFVEEGRMAMVDATMEPGEELIETGNFDLNALMARIEYAVDKTGAKRVVLDSVGVIFSQFTDAGRVRRELQRISIGLRALGVTALITVEREKEYGPIARFGVEEFVADNVVILRNQLEKEKRRRTIEILKFRGTDHQKGEFPFSIDLIDGLTVIPLSAIELTQKSSTVRISSGNTELDKMCDGGMFRDSIILVSGPTGTGKTLLSTEFISAACDAGERALLFAFEESREQLMRNAASWGMDIEKAENKGLLKVICCYPESMGLEDHLICIKREIENFKPHRIAVDSLSALERVSNVKSFREFVIGLTSHIKSKETAGLFTNTTSILMGSESVTEAHISTITDSIIVLHYVELQGELRRGIVVLKMRGSWHEKHIREYYVDKDGMHIRGPFKGVSGIMLGSPSYSFQGERNQMAQMFESDSQDIAPDILK